MFGFRPAAFIQRSQATMSLPLEDARLVETLLDPQISQLPISLNPPTQRPNFNHATNIGFEFNCLKGLIIEAVQGEAWERVGRNALLMRIRIKSLE